MNRSLFPSVTPPGVRHVVLALGLVCATAPVQAMNNVILPIGDSITEGVGGQCSYRRSLSQALAGSASCEVSFVGPRLAVNGNTQRCVATNTAHSGIAGYRVDSYSLPAFEQLLDEYQPHFVLFHLGSNDTFQGQSVDSTVAEIDARITTLLAPAGNRPSVTVLLANVIPWDPTQQASLDNPNVDERARTAELAAALEALAARRAADGDAVALVDVVDGFDPALHTYDGVHPNDAGEDIIAARFRSGLEAAGLCETPALPAIDLVQNEWQQLSLPADPGAANTVADVFDELPIAGYAVTWAVSTLDTSVSETAQYQRLALNDAMQPGVGYWVIQLAEPSVRVTLPASSEPAPLRDSAACPSEAGCVTVPLTTSNGASFRWNMAGLPVAVPVSLNSLRLGTSGAACLDGCSLREAADNDVADFRLWHYDPDVAGGYRELSDGDTLAPWEGVWMATLPGAANQSPALVLE